MYRVTDLWKWKDNEDKQVFRYDLKGDHWMVVKLKKGKAAGEHYHKGTAENKNPEVLILLEGKVRCVLKHVETGDEGEFVVDRPSRIEIEPFVFHTFIAVEDSIFLESFTEEAKNDRFTL